MYQKTLKNSVHFEGTGLHSGKVVKLSIKPSEPDTGIVFKRIDLKETIKMRKEFMGKASKLSNVSFNAISAAEYIINKIQEDQKQIELGNKIFDVHIATKQIWALNNAMKLVERGQQTLDEIENGHMSPLDDFSFF